MKQTLCNSFGFALLAAGMLLVGCDPQARRPDVAPEGKAELSVPAASPSAGEKTYWLAVEPIEWSLTPKTAPEKSTLKKALKIYQYTEGFAEKLEPDPLLGLAGPVLEANVGDTLVIHFRNLDFHYKTPHSLNFHGLDYAESMDGTCCSMKHDKPSAEVMPGDSFTYVVRAGETSAGVWLYHDMSVNGLANMALGMFGAVRVHSPRENAVDREFYLFLTSFEKEQTQFDRDYDTINGLSSMENTPVFAARLRERVRFNVLALGDENHTFHIIGNRFWDGSAWNDTRDIGPGQAWSVELNANTAGDWALVCHHSDHMRNGMMATFRVTADQ